MHETREEIDALQRVLDGSYEQAGEHYRSIHTSARRLTAIEVCGLLKGVCVFDLATVNSLGHPIVAPIDGLFLHATLWFGSSQRSLRFKHIRQNPWVSAAFTKGEELSILVHGKAHEIDTNLQEFQPLHDYCVETYGPTYDSWGFWGNEPFAWIEPTRIFASRPGPGDDG